MQEHYSCHYHRRGVVGSRVDGTSTISVVSVRNYACEVKWFTAYSTATAAADTGGSTGLPPQPSLDMIEALNFISVSHPTHSSFITVADGLRELAVMRFL